ncbi:MAG TPA: nucleotidyltransferase domain-containing protein [Ureibacillus sp.]|nr:nucleotidyltransferase domain-containing protein [Ureibacillus sp.]
MKEIIRLKLKEIEEQKNVRILFATDSGSRAWGFASSRSDYDVRFIYIHRPEWYLSIDPQGIGSKKDVIECSIDGNLDIGGWELTKALRLFRKSNPTIFEWLRSEAFYIQNHDFVEKMRMLEIDVLNPVPIAHHYFNLAKGNYKKYLIGNELKIKICLYVVKSLLACHWIKRNNSFPPNRIQDLFIVVNDEKLKQEIKQLVKLKVLGNDIVCASDYQTTYEFIVTNIESVQYFLSAQISPQANITSKLDQLFREVLINVWSDKPFK